MNPLAAIDALVAESANAGINSGRSSVRWALWQRIASTFRNIMGAASTPTTDQDSPVVAEPAVPEPMITSDPLAHLVGEEWEAVVAARIAPYDGTRLHWAMNLLRRNEKLAEVDALYDAAPRAMQCDAAVISLWCSIPRMRREGPEMLRRATQMSRLHPKDVKAYSHMIFALHATKGYDETMRQAESWMAEFPDNENIIAPLALIASDSQQWSAVEQLLRKLEKIFPPGMDADNCFRLVVALRCLAKPDEAAQALDEARAKFPDHPLLAQL
jgi:tetratricopeptide (TPR) repeat protein